METVEMLHNWGWKNFNLDLIYGLPGQSLDKVEQNLKKAVDCEPSHLSLYLLQLEEQTPMGKDVATGQVKCWMKMKNGICITKLWNTWKVRLYTL
jgi:oxygen-independent coproporphyrinogen-3 oxidase